MVGRGEKRKAHGLCTRDIATEIDIACFAGGGPMHAADLVRLMGEGNARLWIGEKMHASAILTTDGVEVFHVYGDSWSDDEARWMLSRLAEYAKEHGRTVGQVSGRKGWRRFLRLKGLKLREV